MQCDTMALLVALRLGTGVLETHKEFCKTFSLSLGTSLNILFCKMPLRTIGVDIKQAASCRWEGHAKGGKKASGRLADMT